jgi:hypothetical protein
VAAASDRTNRNYEYFHTEDAVENGVLGAEGCRDSGRKALECEPPARPLARRNTAVSALIGSRFRQGHEILDLLQQRLGVDGFGRRALLLDL